MISMIMKEKPKRRRKNTMASKMESALKHSISEATEIGKTTIDLDVNINSEQITSQIREAISSASASAGEALNIDLKFNQEELLSNLRSAINKIATGDEPVKVDIDVDKNGLQEKLNVACHDMEIPVDFKIDSEDIASKRLFLHMNLQCLRLNVTSLKVRKVLQIS